MRSLLSISMAGPSLRAPAVALLAVLLTGVVLSGIAAAQPGPAAGAGGALEIRSDTLIATVSTRTGALREIHLTDKKFTDDEGRPRDLAPPNKALFPTFTADVLGVTLPKDATWTATRLSESAVRLEIRANGFHIVRKLEAGEGPYQIWSTVRVTNESAPKHAVRLALHHDHYMLNKFAEGGGMFSARSPEQSDALCLAGEDTIRIHKRDDVAFERHQFGVGTASIAAVETTYFANALIATTPGAEACRLSWFASTDMVTTSRFLGLLGSKTEPEGTLYRAELRYPRKELATGESVTYRTLGYFGPKEGRALNAAGHGLPRVVDLGWFSVVAQYLVALLALIYGYVGNWGVAIIVMTVLFKLLFFPLTWKSFQSLAKMKVLKPEMDRINELYGDDAQKKGAATMELYRKHGVNPLGGCLPQLLQMPVWIAFFASLSTNTELYKANFALHWTDLSAPDSLFILPVIQGLLIFVQQRMTPNTMDPAQAKVMLYFMPLMMMAIYFFMPAGLTLYSVTNTVLTFAQQHLVFRQIEKRSAAKSLASNPPPANDDESEDVDPEAVLAGGPHADTTMTVPKRTTRRRLKRG